MELIIGLGNPGTKFKNNRHNAGHMFVDFINSRNQMSEIRCQKSDTFMNDSGKFVAKIIRNLKSDIRNLYIAHDDLDLKLGTYKVQFGVGPKVHYGVQSVEKELGTKDFWRIRIGVDNRDPSNRTLGEEYVLEDFTSEELKILEDVYAKIGDDLAKI